MKSASWNIGFIDFLVLDLVNRGEISFVFGEHLVSELLWEPSSLKAVQVSDCPFKMWVGVEQATLAESTEVNSTNPNPE